MTSNEYQKAASAVAIVNSDPLTAKIITAIRQAGDNR